MVQLAGSVLILVGAVLSLACVGVYQVWARWWETSSGRHLFSFMAVIAAAMTLMAYRVITSGHFSVPVESGVWPVIRFAVLAAIDWVLAWRLVLIVRAQLGKRRERLEGDR